MKIGIIGAGFAGLIHAYKLSMKGYDVEVYEEHSRVGYPPHCTGLVSQDTVELIGPPALENIVAMYNGVILSAGESSCKINTSNKVVKLDRIKLEEDLKEEAESLGAKIHLGKKVSRVDLAGNVWVSGGLKHYDLVILAEGIGGGLRKKLDINHRLLTTYGYNIELPLEDSPEEYISVHFEYGLAGFEWRVPLPRGALYGVLSRDPRQSKRALSSYMRLGEGRIYGGIVVHGPPLSTPRRGRVLVVGDAAGFNKPLTGGGLYPNSLLAQGLSGLDLASEDFDLVDRTVSDIVGLLSRQYRIARAYYSSPARGFRVLEKILSTEFCGLVDGNIDYDRHDELVGMVLSSPLALIGIVGSLVPNAFIDLMILLMYYLGIKQARV